ncbi:16S rRNA (adenine(1518)-N(6)/adenine(1519)-N(6))-dimethyltransferase RsmA [uncultured Dubosiella sp.]|uniref:16S rRNA (adenine(1518)-N(6)/adenine(1519)-N(6))- dimethyltransferase RsmA n=1 Tax=uncultured Dubosiella sp. TaxID=1937011 RepID=UPI0025B3E871|nr:16S rRNA (adenine(1518)-N(6)/adenine(1519)-N(6))-dimethyltransferase RsmA [uncultured Dubosiella sp.]
MNEAIATIKNTRRIQAQYDVHAKKAFGQNFIIEPKVVEKIADAAIASPNDLVIEVGPGIGALTQFLCEKSEHVVAFEIDERLPEILRAEIRSDHLEILLQDFLEADIDAEIRARRKPGQRVDFVSNLPYYITTPILFKLFEAREHPDTITVMLQKEVGERFLARHSDKAYNALSVITAYRCRVKKVMDVSRHVFMPKPNVDSMVIQFTFVDREPVADEDLFFEMVKACFAQRRKTLYNNLQAWLADKEAAKSMLEKSGLEPSVRAQELELEDFIRLYEENYETIRACKGKHRA